MSIKRHRIKKGRDNRFKTFNELRIGNRYNLEFVDEYDDYIQENIALMYNGVYRLTDIIILHATDFYEEREYAVFTDDYHIVHILNEEQWDTAKHGVTLFHALNQDKSLLLFDEDDSADRYTDFYQFVPCIITIHQPDEDMFLISQVSRKNTVKQLPRDVERKIQSFLINNSNI